MSAFVCKIYVRFRWFRAVLLQHQFNSTYWILQNIHHLCTFDELYCCSQERQNFENSHPLVLQFRMNLSNVACLQFWLPLIFAPRVQKFLAPLIFVPLKGLRYLNFHCKLRTIEDLQEKQQSLLCEIRKL